MKMYAVLNDESIVIDCWLAESFEEAQYDNPNNTVIALTLENSPAGIGWKWNNEKFEEIVNA